MAKHHQSVVTSNALLCIIERVTLISPKTPSQRNNIVSCCFDVGFLARSERHDGNYKAKQRKHGSTMRITDSYHGYNKNQVGYRSELTYNVTVACLSVIQN
jgi:hypothetical protein